MRMTHRRGHGAPAAAAAADLGPNRHSIGNKPSGQIFMIIDSRMITLKYSENVLKSDYLLLCHNIYNIYSYEDKKR